MRGRDIVTGALILLVIAGTIYWLRGRSETSEPQGVIQQMEEKLESDFGMDIPEDLEKTLLKDVSGGTATAIATRDFSDGSFTLTVLADLPDPTDGTVYEGWLIRGKSGDDNFKIISAGVMQVAKGGYLLEFESATDYSDYMGVVITIETVVDANPEEHILEGSF